MESKYNSEYVYAADAYKMVDGKGILAYENLRVVYFEDEDKWVTCDDILMYYAEPLLYSYKYSDDELKQAEILFQKALMPYHDVLEGQLYIEPSSIKVLLTPNNLKSKSSKKKRG